MTVATATKPTAPRKRRTRKVAVKTVKVSRTAKRPSAAKLISPNRYWSDIKTRWSIHQYELTMLTRDLTKLKHYVYQFTKWPLRPHRGLFFVIIKKWERVQSFWTRHTRKSTLLIWLLSHTQANARQGWETIQEHLRCILWITSLYVWRPLVLTVIHPLSKYEFWSCKSWPFILYIFSLCQWVHFSSTSNFTSTTSPIKVSVRHATMN